MTTYLICHPICCVYLRPANIWAALPVAVSTWVALGSNLICFANFVFFPDYIDQIWVVIRWPRICQHLSSLANGRQYLGCPGLKSQIEQSSSHMREIPLAAQCCLIALTHNSTVFAQITVYSSDDVSGTILSITWISRCAIVHDDGRATPRYLQCSLMEHKWRHLANQDILVIRRWEASCHPLYFCCTFDILICGYLEICVHGNNLTYGGIWQTRLLWCLWSKVGMPPVTTSI